MFDYFVDVLDKEYYSKVDFSNVDFFERLRQSYLIQLNMLNNYPGIIGFDKLSLSTKSEDINQEIEKILNNNHKECQEQLLEIIDTTKFREDLNVDRCKNIIMWSNIGLANQILENIKNSGNRPAEIESVISVVDEYFDELKKIFYKIDWLHS